MEDHIVEFTRRPEEEDHWQQCVQNNSDQSEGGYGFAILRYLSKWAQLMEHALAEGKELKDIWESTSREADTEGITGFMYNMAVQILVGCWINGEDLRKLHNLRHQIRNEGEEANEKGTVLNTAILNINVPEGMSDEDVGKMIAEKLAEATGGVVMENMSPEEMMQLAEAPPTEEPQ